MSDHVHLCLSTSPKYSGSYTIAFLKGKRAVRKHRELLRERRMAGLHFCATGYRVSAMGSDETTVRQYTRNQQALEHQQGRLFE